MSKRAIKLDFKDSTGKEDFRYAFKCPGCKSRHYLDGKWTFNGDFEKPTFRASVLTWTEGYKDEDSDIPATRCHSFVTDGRIEYLSDCTHELAGQTVDLPDIEP